MDNYRHYVASADGGCASDSSDTADTSSPGYAEGADGRSVPGGMSRPAQVEGPMGQPLTLDSLPPPNTRRWVVRRKAEVIAAIRGGLLTEAEACARYQLSPEELDLWSRSFERDGVPGLRVTRIQLYRDHPYRSLRPTGSTGGWAVSRGSKQPADQTTNWLR